MAGGWGPEAVSREPNASFITYPSPQPPVSSLSPIIEIYDSLQFYIGPGGYRSLTSLDVSRVCE